MDKTLTHKELKWLQKNFDSTGLSKLYIIQYAILVLGLIAITIALIAYIILGALKYSEYSREFSGKAVICKVDCVELKIEDTKASSDIRDINVLVDGNWYKIFNDSYRIGDLVKAYKFPDGEYRYLGYTKDIEVGETGYYIVGSEDESIISEDKCNTYNNDYIIKTIKEYNDYATYIQLHSIYSNWFILVVLVILSMLFLVRSILCLNIEISDYRHALKVLNGGFDNTLYIVPSTYSSYRFKYGEQEAFNRLLKEDRRFIKLCDNQAYIKNEDSDLVVYLFLKKEWDTIDKRYRYVYRSRLFRKSDFDRKRNSLILENKLIFST